MPRCSCPLHKADRARRRDEGYTTYPAIPFIDWIRRGNAHLTRRERNTKYAVLTACWAISIPMYAHFIASLVN